MKKLKELIPGQPKKVITESVAPGEEERGKIRRMLFNLYKNQVISKEVLREMMDQLEKAFEEAASDFGEMPE